MAIPSVGYYAGLLVKVKTGNVNRFESGGHFCSFISIVPLFPQYE